MTLADRPFPRQPMTSQASGLNFSSVEFVIFGLFATYGPSFALFGQLRILEALLIVYVFLRAGILLRTLRGLQLALFVMFVMSGITHIIAGTYHDAPPTAIFARAGTYFVLALVFLAVFDIGNKDPRRLLLVLSGYALSYVFIMFVGTTTSANYAAQPWRLGLGFAATLALGVFFAAKPKYQTLAPLAFAAMGAVHVVASARSLGAVSLLVAGAALLGQLRKTNRPLPFSTLVIGVCVAGAALATLVGLQGLAFLSELGLLPEELVRKMETQLSHSTGLLAAARPDTVTAIYAIQINPLLGFGPGVVDPEVLLFYAHISAEGLFGAHGDFQDRAIFLYEREWNLGTPSHSHLFGAWADAGIFAAISWFFVFGLAFYVAVRSALFRNAWAPLYLFVAIATLWDVLFSPGPHRMDMAIRLLIMFFAIQHFRSFAKQG